MAWPLARSSLRYRATSRSSSRSNRSLPSHPSTRRTHNSPTSTATRKPPQRSSTKLSKTRGEVSRAASSRRRITFQIRQAGRRKKRVSPRSRLRSPRSFSLRRRAKFRRQERSNKILLKSTCLWQEDKKSHSTRSPPSLLPKSSNSSSCPCLRTRQFPGTASASARA